MSASAVTNHARHDPNNLREDKMILLHNISPVFEITSFYELMCALSQNEADDIFYRVKAMSIITGL